jgi:hypothetical protein
LRTARKAYCRTGPEVLDKYIAALGGAQKLATLKSFIATGSSVGYEGLGGGGSFQILPKPPISARRSSFSTITRSVETPTESTPAKSAGTRRRATLFPNISCAEAN